MDSLLFEDPWIVGCIGALASGLAILVWTQIGARPALYTGLAAALVTVVAIVVNIQVETDSERIRHLLHEVARQLENNRREALLQSIHPNAVEVRRRAEAELPKYEFTLAKVTGIRAIEVNESSIPPTATAEFFVRVHLRYQGQEYRVLRFVRVYFMLRDGRWYVRDYEHFDPSVGMRRSRNT